MALAKVEGDALVFWCPGCKDWHRLTGKKFLFTGGIERPTVSGTVLVITTSPPNDKIHVCRFGLCEGRFLYLRESTHALAGKSVAMVDVADAV